MTDTKYLTADEVVERYRGEVSAGTLRNWRAQRVGPPFIKIGTPKKAFPRTYACGQTSRTLLGL
jgi:hypothetical protein